MAMQRPRSCQFYADKAEYWNRVEAMRTAEGLPRWSFDFISVHKESVFNGGRQTYGLCCPLVYCENRMGYTVCQRPEWERNQYITKAWAIRAARFHARIASREIGRPIHVVYCD